MTAAFQQDGFAVTYDEEGLIGRGLYLAPRSTLQEQGAQIPAPGTPPRLFLSSSSAAKYLEGCAAPRGNFVI